MEGVREVLLRAYLERRRKHSSVRITGALQLLSACRGSLDSASAPDPSSIHHLPTPAPFQYALNPLDFSHGWLVRHILKPSAVTVCNTKNMVECLSPLSASTPTSESEHIEDKLASHEIKQLAMPMQNSASSNSKIKLEVAS